MEPTLSEQLLHQFHLFHKLLHRERARQRHRHHEFNPARGQGHVLGVLLARDGLSQKELSELLQVRPASLGELVGKLEQSGLVERRINDEDKRVINVYLTDKGRAAISGVVDSRSAMIEPLFAGLTEEEKLQLSALLGKLIESIGARPEREDEFRGRPEEFGEAGGWDAGFGGDRGDRPPAPYGPRGFGGPHEGGGGRGGHGHGGHGDWHGQGPGPRRGFGGRAPFDFPERTDGKELRPERSEAPKPPEPPETNEEP